MRTPVAGSLQRALARIVASVLEGLAHGYFDLHITCEIINGERRRLTVQFGKSYQFDIPKEDCCSSASPDRSFGEA